MDESLRRAEREAALDDYDARQRYRRMLVRSGQPDPFELEEHSWVDGVQDGYDDLWWHGNTARKCGLWRGRDFWDCDFKTSVFKAHHRWGHDPYRGTNSKRKTLRTHRDGSRKNYRLRS
jgi:hypothetical protein